MKTKVTYGKPTKKQVEKFERTVKEMVEGRKKRRPRAGVGAEILRVVRAMPHSMHDLACKHSHSPVAEDAIPGKPSVCPCYHCRLEALLATATPEQAAPSSDSEIRNILQEVCQILNVKLGPGLATWVPLIAAVRALKHQQPQAASGGALEPSGYAYRYPDGIRFTDGHAINGSKPIESIPYYFAAALASHDQKVRGEVPWAFAIETPSGDMYDGEYAVFGDFRSAEDQVENLNDDIPEDAAEQYKVVPLFRAAPAASKPEAAAHE